jgi:penicillin-binding protein 1A
MVFATVWAPDAPCAETEGCPTVEELERGVVFEESYHLFDRFGEPLAHVGGANRRWASLEELPPLIPQAWIAVEDRRFQEHGGVDLRGAARAFLANVSAGAVAEGASTIPMQLVRIVWPHEVREGSRWARKLQEIRLAPRLVSELGRDRVLELYLNGLYLGGNVYGVGAAARHYFGVPPDRLDLAQVATLVALTKTPGRLNPRDHPERARARRDVVLEVLAREGVVPEARADAARRRPMRTVAESPVPRDRSYVTAGVRRELRRVAPELAEQEGLVVHTTVDPQAQRVLDSVMGDHLRRVEAGEWGRPTAGSEPVQVGAVAVESATGEILALLGGRDFGATELNRPLQSTRPVGSLAKPFILAAALERGIPASRALATDTLSRRTEEGVWRPADHMEEPWVLPGEMVTRSSNRAAVRLGEEVGFPGFAALIHRVGFADDVPHYPSSFLGSFEASLASVTGAYATLENGGHPVTPHLVRRVEAADGRVLWRSPSLRAARPDRALSPETAHQVLDALRDVVDRGTGWRVRRHLTGAAGGKTGTTDGGADAWFVGVRPGLAAGVWVGLDRPGTIAEGAGGGRLAAPAWGRWMAAMEELEYGTGSWSSPGGLSPVPLALRSAGDSAVVCLGGDGRRALVRSDRVPGIAPCPRTLTEVGATGSGGDVWTRDGITDPDSLRRLTRDSIPQRR